MQSSLKRPECARVLPNSAAAMGLRSYAAPFRRSRLVRSLGVAAAALALGGLPPSRGNGAEPPVAQETGSQEAAQARAASREEAQARAASRECLTRAAESKPVSRVSRVSRFECDVELLPELARLSVFYGADSWSGGRVSSWQELRAEPLLPGIDHGFFEPETGLVDWRDWQDAESRMRLEGKSRGLRYRAEYGFFQDGSYKAGFARRPSALSSTRSGGSFEASWNLGFLQPKVEVGRSWKLHPEQDPRVQDPRANEEDRSKARLAIAVPLPHLPLLTLSAGRVSRSLTPTGHRLAEPDVNEVMTDVASASLWYGRERWSASVTSSYFEVAKNQKKASEAVMQDYIATLSYRLTDSFSVEPLVEYMKTTYPGLDYGATSSLASLGLYHASSGGRRTYVYASYYADRDSGDYGGYIDTRSTDLAVGLEQDIRRLLGPLGLRHSRQSIGLQFSAGHYGDLVYREASMYTWGAFVQIRIQP